MKEQGRHLVIDYWDCSTDLLNDETQLIDLLVQAAEAANARVISTHAHQFDHQGVTAVAILAESHISIHTWPATGYAGVDVYTCGTCKPLLAHEMITGKLKPGRVDLVELLRGDAHSPRSITATPRSPLLVSGMAEDQTCFVEGTVPGRRYGNVSHSFRISERVFQTRTPFQDCLIFDNPVYGRVLVLDGIVQLSTFDEHIYHEMLVHPAMFTHPDPRTVCIVGGGDGGTLREVLKHNPDKVIMIDIDEAFVHAAAAHLPTLSHGAFDDPRVTILYEDARVAIERFDRVFDAVIIDCNDAVGPSEALFESDFYAAVAHALKPGGVCSVQAGSMLDLDFLERTRDRAALHLGNTQGFKLTIPCYHCGEYMFFVAAGDRNPYGPDTESLEDLQRQRGVATVYWSPKLHHASQTVPAVFDRTPRLEPAD